MLRTPRRRFAFFSILLVIVLVGPAQARDQAVGPGALRRRKLA